MAERPPGPPAPPRCSECDRIVGHRGHALGCSIGFAAAVHWDNVRGRVDG